MSNFSFHGIEEINKVLGLSSVDYASLIEIRNQFSHFMWPTDPQCRSFANAVMIGTFQRIYTHQWVTESSKLLRSITSQKFFNAPLDNSKLTELSKGINSEFKDHPRRCTDLLKKFDSEPRLLFLVEAIFRAKMNEALCSASKNPLDFRLNLQTFIEGVYDKSLGKILGIFRLRLVVFVISQSGFAVKGFNKMEFGPDDAPIVALIQRDEQSYALLYPKVLQLEKALSSQVVEAPVQNSDDKTISKYEECVSCRKQVHSSVPSANKFDDGPVMCLDCTRDKRLCNICKKPFGKSFILTNTDCGHVFCKGCLQNEESSLQKLRCPHQGCNIQINFLFKSDWKGIFEDIQTAASRRQCSYCDKSTLVTDNEAPSYQCNGCMRQICNLHNKSITDCDCVCDYCKRRKRKTSSQVGDFCNCRSVDRWSSRSAPVIPARDLCTLCDQNKREYEKLACHKCKSICMACFTPFSNSIAVIHLTKCKHSLCRSCLERNLIIVNKDDESEILDCSICIGH